LKTEVLDDHILVKAGFKYGEDDECCFVHDSENVALPTDAQEQGWESQQWR
jgi:hypothetical protein